MSRVSLHGKTNRQLNKADRRKNVAYINGTAAPKLSETSIREEKEKISNRHAVRKNRDKASYMNFGYVSFMIIALAAACIVLMGYINLQSDVTNRVSNIAKLESQLNNLKISNDEEYNRIMSSVDLEEIKRIAIDELGMRYAKDGQVVTYSGEGSDYVRQYSDIPKK